jgi:hypothetical protein
LYLFFAPVSRTSLSDKDIVASTVSASPEINERNTGDEAYTDHSERLSNMNLTLNASHIRIVVLTQNKCSSTM